MDELLGTSQGILSSQNVRSFASIGNEWSPPSVDLTIRFTSQKSSDFCFVTEVLPSPNSGIPMRWNRSKTAERSLHGGNEVLERHYTGTIK
jgi:hypothetical protein